MSAAIYFVSGIDTEIGKTYATGYLMPNFGPNKGSVLSPRSWCKLAMSMCLKTLKTP